MKIDIILAKLVVISVITIFLIIKKGNNQVGYFSEQTWSTREVLPVYWTFIFIFIIWLSLYRNNHPGIQYVYASIIFTFLAGFALLLAAKIISHKHHLMWFRAIRAIKSDLYWLLILIASEYSFLLFFSIKQSSDHIRIFLLLGYFSITLVFWPVIESVLYLGMMFIPTSRIVGLINSAILISLLQALSHLDHRLAEMLINFSIFGLLSCFLYFKSKRIIIPILLHSLINFFILMRDLNFLTI